MSQSNGIDFVTRPDLEPEPEPTPESEPESTPEPSSGKASAYDPCGKSKGCFGYPESCYAKGGCTVGVLYSLNEKGQAEVELRGEKLPGGKYMAVGLSEDASMGGDVVFSCSSSGPGIQVSWNQGKSNNAGVENITITGTRIAVYVIQKLQEEFKFAIKLWKHSLSHKEPQESSVYLSKS